MKSLGLATAGQGCDAVQLVRTADTLSPTGCRILLKASSLTDAVRAGLLSRKHPGRVFFSAGCAPFEQFQPDTPSLLAHLAQDNQALTVGPYRALYATEKWRGGLGRIMELALSLDKPLLFSCSLTDFEYFRPLLEIFQEEGGVLIWDSANEPLAQEKNTMHSSFEAWLAVLVKNVTGISPIGWHCVESTRVTPEAVQLLLASTSQSVH
jgi:hypothetical protein